MRLGAVMCVIHIWCPDNVHFQHTAHLVQALTEEEIQFRVQVTVT